MRKPAECGAKCRRPVPAMHRIIIARPIGTGQYGRHAINGRDISKRYKAAMQNADDAAPVHTTAARLPRGGPRWRRLTGGTFRRFRYRTAQRVAFIGGESHNSASKHTAPAVSRPQFNMPAKPSIGKMKARIAPINPAHDGQAVRRTESASRYICLPVTPLYCARVVPRGQMFSTGCRANLSGGHWLMPRHRVKSMLIIAITLYQSRVALALALQASATTWRNIS